MKITNYFLMGVLVLASQNAFCIDKTDKIELGADAAAYVGGTIGANVYSSATVKAVREIEIEKRKVNGIIIDITSNPQPLGPMHSTIVSQQIQDGDDVVITAFRDEAEVAKEIAQVEEKIQVDIQFRSRLKPDLVITAEALSRRINILENQKTALQASLKTPQVYPLAKTNPNELREFLLDLKNAKIQTITKVSNGAIEKIAELLKASTKTKRLTLGTAAVTIVGLTDATRVGLKNMTAPDVSNIPTQNVQ